MDIEKQEENPYQIMRFNDAATGMQADIAKQKPFGTVKDIRPADPPSEYIVYTSDTGNKKHVHRDIAIRRSIAFLQMLENETGSADPVQMDKEVMLLEKTFKAVKKSYERDKMPLSPRFVQEFWQRVRKVERTWRTVADYKANRNKPQFNFNGKLYTA